MKALFRRVLSGLLAVCMLAVMLPIGTNAATSTNPMTVTLRSEDGTLVEGASITAVAARNNSSYELTVVEAGDGKYTIYRGSYNRRNYTITILVTADGYEDASTSVRGNTTSTSITMTPEEVVEQWQEFELFYYLNGSEEDPFPDSYAAAGDIGNYGPSGDNTPFAVINVNITALAENYPDAVVYEEDTAEGNVYQFTPVESEDRIAAAEAFWAAVLECTDEASIAALEATGLSDWLVGYVLKYDGGSYHGDGILEVTPPVYSIELYKDDTASGGTYSYVGGLITTDGEEFKSLDDVLTALEGYLGYTITWEEDENGIPVAVDGVYTGTYIHEEHLHTVTIQQVNMDAATVQPEGSEIAYEEKSEYYYVAYYLLNVQEAHDAEFIITYTDGDANGTVFYDHSYGVAKVSDEDLYVPAFGGSAVREGYNFLGWVLEGGDGTVYSDAEVQAMTVTANMVFHAEWSPIPLTYTGSVHVILNGTYDATSHTITSGTYIDINAVTGSQVQLYVKEESSTEYIPLTTREGAVGIYDATLENGNYTIHYSLDGGATIKATDDQLLTVNNADRHRYLFFNSVEYDLNGGEAAADISAEYYQTGMTNVHVSSAVPVRDRYVFSHWTDENGNVYAPGDLLTAEISQPYVLTANWTAAMDVYLNIKITHVAQDGVSHNNDDGRHDIFFTLDQRTENGDYTEIYDKTITWDGITAFADPVYEAAYMQTTSDYTLYTASMPVLENVDAAAEYTFTTTKSGYSLVSVTQEYDENGDLIIYAELIFDPNNFDFAFSVRLDEEAKQLPEEFKPVAVDVKVTSWYDTPHDEDYGQADTDETEDWYTITQQRYTYERIVLDENGEGTGSFPVWIGTADAQAYHYRIEVVSFEMPDGEINPATNVNGENVTYLSDCEHVEAKIQVTGGKSPDAATSLTGAYYEDGQQVGQVEAVISIHTYSVTFAPNGGTLNGTVGNTVVEPLFQIPDLEAYIPVRDGGYVFDGWYLADENGEMTDAAGESFAPLHSDIMLIAKWKEPLSVTANVAVDTAYQQTNADGSVTTQTIRESDYAAAAVVTLQKILENGYPETVATMNADLSYADGMGCGSVTFTQIPDDGHTYRVLVMVPNYTFTYQHEPESLDGSKNTDYQGSYNDMDYTAEFGVDTLAVVNAYGAFTPHCFDLEHEVDATAIAEGFRPDSAEILITYDDDTGILDASQWPVISQMVFDSGYIGYHTELTNGVGRGTTSVWSTYPDGITVSEYALRLQSTETAGVTAAYDGSTSPFTVEYRIPAYYVAPDGQSQLLQAVLTPRQYAVVYELDGGTLSGTYPTAHTWSYATDISGAVPAKSGYVFDGWYLDEALAQPAGDSIDASIHEEITLYAKWKIAQDRVNLTVVIDHMQGNDPNSSTGQAAVYDRILYVQLTSHEDGGESAAYTPVADTQKAYDSSYWHTMEDGTAEEVFSVSGIYHGLPSDMAYSAIASMEGYEIVEELCSVTPNYDEESETGTTYDVEIYLEYHPELLTIDFTVRMDEAVDTALDPAAAYVKVTSWYDQPDAALSLGWHEITQHKESYVTVTLDDTTRSGTGSYQVWQWYLEEQAMPFFYRIEVVGLVLDDGTVVDMQPQEAEVSYTGGIYTATVYADNGAEEPIPQDETHNTTLLGVYGAYQGEALEQVGTLEAVITVSDPIKVTFHANNPETLDGEDVFRTYYSAGAAVPEGGFHLTGSGQVESFYEIPAFAYETHNSYIFKGWYMGTEEDAEPMDWDTAYTGDTHIYAHWIEVGEVAKEDDGKIYVTDLYSEYDLMGTQIRTSEQDLTAHYGSAGAGLRFITTLSERVYQEMNGIHTENHDGIEYGFVIAKTAAVEAAADGDDYMLKYKHAAVNGEDTTAEYSYVINTPCRVPDKEVVDHFTGENYRLYTAVITYKNLTGDKLAAAQNTYFIARSYLRYFDANGLERVHYNNYTGNSATCGGVNTCYADVYALVSGQ